MDNPKDFLLFEGKISCEAFCRNRQIKHKGISHFGVFSKIQKGVATYKSDFEGRF
jgi:hypothetical protein